MNGLVPEVRRSTNSSNDDNNNNSEMMMYNNNTNNNDVLRTNILGNRAQWRNSVKAEGNILSFRRRLKTYLFNATYPP